MIVTVYITVADYWKLKKDLILEKYVNPATYTVIMVQDVLPEIGMLRFPELAVSDLERILRNQRNHGYCNGRLQDTKAVLRRLFHLAREDRLLADNPVDRLKVIPTTYRELTALSARQELALLRAFRLTSRPELYTLILITGIPLRELCACRVSDYDPEGRRIMLTRFASRNRGIVEKPESEWRLVPLSGPASGIMEKAVEAARSAPVSRKEPPSELSGDKTDDSSDRLIFTDRQGRPPLASFRPDLLIMRSETGMERLILRDLEHCFGIRAISLGANPKALNRYLGYKTGFNVMRYAGAHREITEEAEVPGE